SPGMSKSIDQAFVHAKQWLLSSLAGSPGWVVQVASILINIFMLLAVFLTLFALISVLERKILARMQNRYGPNRVGPFGLFQPIADGIKMLIKEDIVAARAIAQMFSYELPLIISVLPVVMVVGSLTPDRIVAAQAGYTFGLVPRWFAFTPWGAAAFILFSVSGLVESNRTPFDVPEGES